MERNVSNEEITALFQRYSDMVYRLALSHTADSHTAEDVFQEVFLKLVENIDKLTTEEHIKYWLIRVTINCCKKSFRHQSDLVDYDDALEKEPEQDTALASSGEENVLERERTALIRSAMKDLKPPEYRDILYLFYFEELKIEEIARIMRITSGNAKTKLFRARASLRKLLEGKV